MTAEEIIKKLNLIPHPAEGGFFVEYYRSEEMIKKEALHSRYDGDRAFGTSIYFLLTKDTFSQIHRLKSDEIFHFYMGDPVEMLHLYPGDKSEKIIFGNDIFNNMKLQVIVPKNIWQGARLIDGGEFALMGTTVAPGFEFSDYEDGDRASLIRDFPEYKELITKLTH